MEIIAAAVLLGIFILIFTSGDHYEIERGERACQRFEEHYGYYPESKADIKKAIEEFG